jgi:glycosyltransferase involved in cell wall biosynthesis
MNPQRLAIICVSQMPASPPRFGAQARMHGLITQLARHHDLTPVMLVDYEFDIEECRLAMQAYCRDVVLVPSPYRRSPVLFPWPMRFAPSPPRERLPALVVDSHNIDYDLARQYARSGGLVRRLYAGANWRKLRREELGTYREADGLYLCSVADQRRLLEELPGARTLVIPNAADVEYYQPRATDRPPDGRTVVFFGHFSHFPNIDGVTHLVNDIWPRIAKVHPEARSKIIGARHRDRSVKALRAGRARHHLASTWPA